MPRSPEKPRSSVRRRKAWSAGSVTVWVALAIPLFLVAGGIAVNVGNALLARQRIQLAVDLAAQAGAISYGRDVDAARAAGLAADVASLNGAVVPAARSWNAATKTLAAGEATITLGPGITDASRTAITVTVARPVSMAFAAIFGIASRTVSATGVAEAWNLPTATGGAACVLALHPSAASAIKVDNMGRIDNAACDIVANSTAAGTGANAAVYLNSGTLRGKTIATPGKLCLSNSGANTVAPAMANNSCIAPGSAARADPFAALPVPLPSQPTGCAINATYGACCIPPLAATVSGVSPAATNVANQSYTAWQSTTRSFSPANGGVFCGNTTIGGNGVADSFAPGIYYVINGNLTFNNSAIASASGVSFVLLGRNGGNPGAISWTNYSNAYTVTAPSSGPTANIVFWQTCRADGTAPENTMAGGSTLVLSGALYAKCGALTLSNNIQMNAASGAGLKVVASTIYVAGSAGIAAAATAPATGAASVALVR